MSDELCSAVDERECVNVWKCEFDWDLKRCEREMRERAAQEVDAWREDRFDEETAWNR